MHDAASVGRLFDDVRRTLGGIDALVNNAGIAGPTAACEDIALRDWERTLAVNLTGQFLCAQRAIPMLRQSSNASIANLSSAAAWGNLLSQDAGVNSGFELQYNLGYGTWAFSRALSDSAGSGAVQVHGSTAPSTGTWYHLVGVFDQVTSRPLVIASSPLPLL